MEIMTKLVLIIERGGRIFKCEILLLKYTPPLA